MSLDLIGMARETSIAIIKKELENFEKETWTNSEVTSEINSMWKYIMNDRHEFRLILGSDKKYHNPTLEDQNRIMYYCCLKFLEEKKSEEVSTN